MCDTKDLDSRRGAFDTVRALEPYYLCEQMWKDLLARRSTNNGAAKTARRVGASSGLKSRALAVRL